MWVRESLNKAKTFTAHSVLFPGPEGVTSSPPIGGIAEKGWQTLPLEFDGETSQDRFSSAQE
jgi:hypothetical protein